MAVPAFEVQGLRRKAHGKSDNPLERLSGPFFSVHPQFRTVEWKKTFRNDGGKRAKKGHQLVLLALENGFACRLLRTWLGGPPFCNALK
jgi:hypothetical protein